eukprot:5097033-Alexandrium_andersonii.AAC.1
MTSVLAWAGWDGFESAAIPVRGHINSSRTAFVRSFEFQPTLDTPVSVGGRVREPKPQAGSHENALLLCRALAV